MDLKLDTRFKNVQSRSMGTNHGIFCHWLCAKRSFETIPVVHFECSDHNAALVYVLLWVTLYKLGQIVQ